MTAVSNRRVADDLYELTRALSEAGWEPSGGLLGGEFGYGAPYENDTFEMHPFWWGDCDCGHETAEYDWDAANPHQPACEFDMTYRCTCSHSADWKAWAATHDHDPKCGVARPNFLHKASGIRVDWYKYIGRGMEFEPVSRNVWDAALKACTDSIHRNPDYVKPATVEPMTDAEMAKWAEENIYVFEGSFGEVLQQVDETFHPVAAIERLEP